MSLPSLAQLDKISKNEGKVNTPQVLEKKLKYM